MKEILSSSQITQAVRFATPGMNSSQSIFLECAQALRTGYLMSRKIYLGAKNPISFAAGSAISLAFGQNDSLQLVARFVLGSLSALRCSEDLHKLKNLQKKCRRIVSGKEYLPIKGDKFNIRGSKSKAVPQYFDEIYYNYKMRMERTAALIRTIGEMFIVFSELMLHAGDIYVAFNEECLSEVIIHSMDLWDALTSDQAYLIQELKRNETFNDWLLGRVNIKTSICTKALIGLLAFPSQVVNTLPDTRDVTQTIKSIYDEAILNAKLNMQDLQTGWRKICGIDPGLLSHNYHYFKKGSNQDPETTRWIPPPKRIRKQIF